MRKRKRNSKFIVFITLLLIGIFVFLSISFFIGPERKAKRVVHYFYEYESASDFGRSWELLHTAMKAKFDRGSYVQDRAHVFNGHFGADTFSFDISGAKEMKNWEMEKGGEVFDSVYAFEVKQDFHGKYGHFAFVQYVYVVREEGDFRIVWDYKR